MTYFTKRFEKLSKECDTSKMHMYFGIKNQKISIENFEEEYDIDQGYCILSVLYERNRVFLDKDFFYNLPIEINKEIMSYLPEYIDLKFRIEFKMGYPFQEPKWILQSIKHNMSSLMNLEHYYKYLVKKHNRMNYNNWIPGIFIDGDLIEFLRLINHFEYIH